MKSILNSKSKICLSSKIRRTLIKYELKDIRSIAGIRNINVNSKFIEIVSLNEILARRDRN